MERTFTTTFRNLRQSEGVILYERNGAVLKLLQPGETFEVETWNPQTIYARWTEVDFLEGGDIRFTENQYWPRPQGWTIEAINIDGKPVEYRIIGGREVTLPRGVPRLVELTLDAREIVYSRMEIKRVTERQPSALFPGFVARREFLQDVYVDKTEAELEQVRAAIEAEQKHGANVVR